MSYQLSVYVKSFGGLERINTSHCCIIDQYDFGGIKYTLYNMEENAPT